MTPQLVKKILALPLIIFSLTNCSRDFVEDLNRSIPPDYQKNPPISQKPPKLNDPVDGNRVSACEVIEQLSEHNKAGSQGFSYFHQLTGDIGAIDIAKSPFTQLIIAENFRVPTRREFYKQARAEYKAGRLSRTKWYMLKLAYKTGFKFDSILYSTVNEKLTQAFPGIYGSSEDVSKSLKYSLILKVLNFTESLGMTTNQYLSQEVPLFTSSEWMSYPIETQVSLSAAIQNLNFNKAPLNEEESLCGLVLLHRGFSQLLRIKGHMSPSIISGTPSWIDPLNEDDNRAFRTVELPGAYSDSEGRAKVLTAEEIQNYDPSVSPFMLMSHTPQQGSQGPRALLADRLSLLESLVTFYYATSPMAPWVSEISPYLIGDLETNPHALLPFEAHSLSLGLLTMEFKNLAMDSIHEINVEGAIRQPDEPAAGVMIAQINGDTTTTLELNHILQMTRSVVYLEHALNQFKGKSAENIRALHPAYSIELLAQLLGREVLTEKELKKLFPKGGFNQSSTLIAQLKKLQLPLAYLLLKFNNNGCVSTADWNTKTGEITPTEACTPELQEELKATKNILARHSGSPILWDPEK